MMGQLKFISREKLVEYLDEELRQFFNERGLHEINQYGWIGDGEQDPECLGHAMWQTNPPKLKKLLGLGDEFTNLMKSARHSLGLACLYHDATDSLVNDCGFSFSYHLADTTNKLDLASDLIREFFIVVFTQRFPTGKFWSPVGGIIQDRRKYDTFSSPFQLIQDEIATWSNSDLALQECLQTLLPLAEEIARNRSASRDLCQHLILFNNRIIAAAANLDMGYPDEVLSDDLSCAVDSFSQELVSRYDALVKASNQVFLAEHLLRGLTSQSDTVDSPSREHRSS